MNWKNLFLLVGALSLLTAMVSCKSDGYAPKDYPKPNPLIGRKTDGFFIKPDSFPGAQMVTIRCFDGKGVLLDSTDIAPGNPKEYAFGPDYKRPFQLRLQYRGVNKKVLGEDSFQVDDYESNNGGVIALDILMGNSAPNTNPAISTPPACPTVSSSATSTMGSVSTPMATGDWFQVTMKHGTNPEVKVGVFVTADSPSKLNVFKSNVYNCLSNTAIEMDPDSKYVEVEVSPGHYCTINGSQNGNVKTLTVEGDDCLITVRKKLP